MMSVGLEIDLARQRKASRVNCSATGPTNLDDALKRLTKSAAEHVE